MKTKLSPERESDVVDKIVEDLVQQDVLPFEGEGELGSEPGAEANAEDQVGSWTNSEAGKGHRAERTPLEDETKAAEVLVNRGVDEAEEELEELGEGENESEEE
jgi:TATA-binding protein-associated factor Taf7